MLLSQPLFFFKCYSPGSYAEDLYLEPNMIHILEDLTHKVVRGQPPLNIEEKQVPFQATSKGNKKNPSSTS